MAYGLGEDGTDRVFRRSLGWALVNRRSARPGTYTVFRRSLGWAQV